MKIAGLTTRQAIPSDVDGIAEAHRDSIRSIGAGFYPPNVVDDWEEGLTGDVYLKAMEGGEVFFIATGTIDGRNVVLGFASDYCIEGPKHGTSVYVRGIAARQGIGSTLFGLAEAHAKVSGASCIQVEASFAGVEFYKANGFIELGRGETRLMSGRSIACVFMRKDLGADSNVLQAVPYFWVHDLELSIRFYVDGLGFRMTKQWVDDGRLRWCWLELGDAAVMLQEFWKDGGHRNVPDGKVGVGVSVCFICRDALALWREVTSRGISAKRPFVGNGMWVTQVTDPDGYDLCFESPTDVAEETVFSDGD